MRVFNQKRWFNSPSNNLFPPPHKSNPNNCQMAPRAQFPTALIAHLSMHSFPASYPSAEYQPLLTGSSHYVARYSPESRRYTRPPWWGHWSGGYLSRAPSMVERVDRFRQPRWRDWARLRWRWLWLVQRGRCRRCWWKACFGGLYPGGRRELDLNMEDAWFRSWLDGMIGKGSGGDFTWL